FLQRPIFVEQPVERRYRVFRIVEQCSDFPDHLALFIDKLLSGRSGNSLNAPYAGGDGTLRGNFEKPNLTGPPHMRTAAQFLRKFIIKSNHPDLITIFFTE